MGITPLTCAALSHVQSLMSERPGKTSVRPPLGEATRQYEGPLHHYRPQQEPLSPQQQLPASSQADGVGQVPRTHRLITLADHICVSCSLIFPFLVNAEGIFHREGIIKKMSRFFMLYYLAHTSSTDLPTPSFFIHSKLSHKILLEIKFPHSLPSSLPLLHSKIRHLLWSPHLCGLKHQTVIAQNPSLSLSTIKDQGQGFLQKILWTKPGEGMVFISNFMYISQE